MLAPATVAAFRAEGLVKRFGARRALDGVGISVGPGIAMGLVGANGAGKTTFIKCALDLCAADSGRVKIFGLDSRQAAARARLAYLPERFVPPYYLLGREFLAMTLELAGAYLYLSSQVGTRDWSLPGGPVLQGEVPADEARGN